MRERERKKLARSTFATSVLFGRFRALRFGPIRREPRARYDSRPFPSLDGELSSPLSQMYKTRAANKRGIRYIAQAPALRASERASLPSRAGERPSGRARDERYACGVTDVALRKEGECASQEKRSITDLSLPS